MLRKFILLFIVIALTGGCKKRYPDNTWAHFKSPKTRLTQRQWTFYHSEFLTSYSYTFAGSFLDETVSFLKDGTCTGGNLSASSPEMIYLFDFNGTWEFMDNDRKIKIMYKKNPSYSKIWTISRLENRGLDIYCDSVKYSLYIR